MTDHQHIGDTMEPQTWSNAEEKFAYVLTLRENEIHLLKVTVNVLTLKRNLKGVIEALEQGKTPADAGAKSCETLDARTIRIAEVSPGNGKFATAGRLGTAHRANTAGHNSAPACWSDVSQVSLIKSDSGLRWSEPGHGRRHS
jgi:hypothetical protein